MPKTSDSVLDDMVQVEAGWWLTQGLPVIGWDLDSTVCSTVHRRHMVPAIRAGGPDAPTWCDYSLQCAGDEPVPGSVALMREMSLHVHIAVSGRSLLARDLTREWVKKHQVPLAAVLLRPEGDHTPNGTWKVRVIRALQRAGADVSLFFEDWKESADEIVRETGIPVVGINPFDGEVPGL